jgi:hypothetical protein
MADDTKPNEAGLALLNAQMDSLAREVGVLDREDPKRADLVKEIFRLAELSAEMRRAFNETLQ